jgi:hypothetical protein
MSKERRLKMAKHDVYFNIPYGYKMGWAKFDELMQEEASRFEKR